MSLRSTKRSRDVDSCHEGTSQGPVIWQEYDSQILTNWFQIMVIGPLLATKYFLPNLERSEAGKVVNLTSKLGSIGCKIDLINEIRSAADEI